MATPESLEPPAEDVVDAVTAPGARRAAGRALVLVGHGSHLSADSSAPVYANAARLRGMGIFDEVLEAFWKEEPSLRDALDLVESSEIYVVPLFLAEGYFTRQVVPRELGIEGPVSHRPGRTIRYCPPVGTHPSMASLVVRRAMEMPGLSSDELSATTLLIIGHGTPRSRTSGDTVYRLVEQIRGMGIFGGVDCGFLDEEPRIADVLARTEAGSIALVPFFLAEGWHTATTIPEEIGLEQLTSGAESVGRPVPQGAGQPNSPAGTRRQAEDGEGDVRGAAEGTARRVWYSRPIGTMPEMTDVILDVVESAGGYSGANRQPPSASDRARSPVRGGPEPRQRPAGADPAFRSPAGSSAPIVRARDRFTAWLGEQGESSSVMQVAIRRSAAGGYRLMHLNDATTSEGLQPISSPAELRELIRFNPAGEYRPLRTRNDLPSGWAIDLPDAGAVWEALSIVYPAALLHWFRAQVGDLEIVPFRRWANRQTGIYDVVRDLSENDVARVVENCCGSCLRRPLWLDPAHPREASTRREDSPSSRVPTPSSSEAERPLPAALEIPCREPCTLFATIAREVGQRR